MHHIITKKYCLWEKPNVKLHVMIMWNRTSFSLSVFFYFVTRSKYFFSKNISIFIIVLLIIKSVSYFKKYVIVSKHYALFNQGRYMVVIISKWVNQWNCIDKWRWNGSIFLWFFCVGWIDCYDVSIYMYVV